jgi:hypothetical protein
MLVEGQGGSDRPERFFVLECDKIERGLAQLK